MEEGLFTMPSAENGPPSLLGGKCPSCHRTYFPKPGFCRVCLEPTTIEDLGSKGTIYSFTVVRTKPPFGLPKPYAVGYVDLEDNGLRIFTLLDPETVEDLHIGQKVRLAVGPLGDDGKGGPLLRPYFSPRIRN